MDFIERGRVVHAGTLNGNPLTLAAARAALHKLMSNSEVLYADLFRRGEALRSGIVEILNKRGHKICAAGEGSVFHISFIEGKPRNYRDLLAADRQKYSDFVLALLDEGILPLPDGRWYMSTAHSDEDIHQTLEAVERAAG